MHKLRVFTVVGARPQFVKAAQVSHVLRQRGHGEFLLHTGQHYDRAMSSAIVEDVDLPIPDLNLGVGSGHHGKQTAAMLAGIEEALLDYRPDVVLVYGDTNSTLAGALAGAKLGMHVAHVEAGLRSYRRSMPEEINRSLTDRISDTLLCPTVKAIENLKAEGISRGVHLVGDVMYDSVLQHYERAKSSDALSRFNLQPGMYALATVHRAENTDDGARLQNIVAALDAIAESEFPVILPVHPRTRKKLEEQGLSCSKALMVDPLSYLEMLLLEKHARFILTDSGGVQKEAFWFGVPCITLREETEWEETAETGWNVLAGADFDRITSAVRTFEKPAERPALYGSGNAAQECVTILESAIS